MVRVRHREGLHAHSSRPSDTLRDLNFELDFDALVVFLRTVDDDVLVLHSFTVTRYFILMYPTP